MMNIWKMIIYFKECRDPNGIKEVGEYKNDKFWNGFVYGKNGNIIGQKVNGERIRE